MSCKPKRHQHKRKNKKKPVVIRADDFEGWPDLHARLCLRPACSTSARLVQTTLADARRTLRHQQAGLTVGTEAGASAGSAACKMFAHHTMSLAANAGDGFFADSTSTRPELRGRSAPSSARPDWRLRLGAISCRPVPMTRCREAEAKPNIRIGDPFDPQTQLGP